MEFGSLGLGFPSQSALNQTGTTGAAQTATLQTNPETTVTPVDSGGASQNDRRRDTLGQNDTALGSREDSSPEDLRLSSRRTTINFDSEQNRIFLEVVDTNTDEVIEQIPSDQLVEQVRKMLETANGGGGTGEEAQVGTVLAV